MFLSKLRARLGMFGFGVGQSGSGENKENDDSPPRLMPPWLKRQRVSPVLQVRSLDLGLLSPQTAARGQGLLNETLAARMPSIEENKHTQTVKIIR